MNLLKNWVNRGIVLSLLLILISSFFVAVEASDPELSVDVIDNTNYNSGGGEQFIDVNLSVQTSDPTSNLCGAKVYIANNFNQAEDSLSYSEVDGLTATYNSNIGVLEVLGVANAAKYQEFLRGIKLNTTATTGTKRIEYIVNKLQDGKKFNLMYFNGHFYEFVNATNIKWSDARYAASQRSFCGLNGYLAVITSQEENDFISSKCEANGWLGAEDSQQEGVWKWVTSPIVSENVQFWSGLGANSGGIVVNNMYSNWNAGVEPNNQNGEHYLHMHSGYWDNVFSEAMKGTWNDFPNFQLGNMGGYIVEYGDRFLNIVDVDWIDSVNVNIFKFPDPPVITFSNSHKILVFDGSDDYIDLGSMILGDSFTIEMWTKWNSIGQWARFFDFGNGAPNNNIIGSAYDNTKKNSFEIYQSVGYDSTKQVISDEQIPENQWIHAAFSYDNVTQKGTIYWNGKLIKHNDCHITPNLSRAYNFIGKSNWVGNALFSGGMKDIRIWNYAKSAEQITLDMNNILAGTEAGLLAYYPLNEESGNVANNLVGSSSANFSTTANIFGNAVWENNELNFPFSTQKNTPVSVNVKISDDDTSIDQLTITATSDNQTLIANSNIELTGTGEDKVLTLTPINNQLGSANITITASDTIYSISETFTFNVYDDQDGSIGFSDNTYSVIENNNATITINKSAGLAKASAVSYAITAGTASSSDFTPASGVVRFNPGETTTTFNVTITDDTSVENDETITLTLSDPHGGARIENSNAVLTIIDNEGPPNVLQSPVILTVLEEDPSENLGVTVADAVNNRITYAHDIGIAVVNIDDSNGSWSYLSGGVGYAISDISESNSLLLPSNAKLIFNPNENWSGSANIIVRGWDKTTGSDFTKVAIPSDYEDNGFSSETLTLTVQINPVNDKPTLSLANNSKIVKFDGVNDYVDLGNATLPEGTFTVEMWTKWTNYGIYSRFFEFGNGPGSDGRGSDNILASVDQNTGKYLFQIRQGANSQSISTETETIPLNKWIHTAFIYDSSIQKMSILLNGKFLVEGEGHNPILLERVKNYLGKSNWDIDDTIYGDTKFNGFMKDVRIWSSARTPSQILNNMYGELTGSEDGLIGYYKMNEQIGAVINNSSDSDIFEASASLYGDAEWVEDLGISTPVVTKANTPFSFDFIVDDVETDMTSAVVSAQSSNTELIANDSIVISGANKLRTITLTPATDKFGTAVITLTTSDGENTTIEQFDFTVLEDQEPSISFSNANFSVNENGNYVHIVVNRAGNLKKEVKVDFEVVGITADLNDYSCNTNSLTFAKDEATLNITIWSTDDSKIEGNETLKVNITNVSSGAKLGDITTATLTIVDDEIDPGPPVITDTSPFQFYTKAEDFTERTGVSLNDVALRINSMVPPGEAGVAITSVDSNGTLQYYNGGYWYPIVNVSETNAFLLPRNAEILFIPNENWNGTATITLRGWDKRSGNDYTYIDAAIYGHGTGFSNEELDLKVTITPVNDGPIVCDTAKTKVLFFDGNKINDDGLDYVQIESMTLPASFTIEMSSKWLALNNWSRFFDFGNGSPNNNVWAGLQGDNGEVLFESFSGGGTNKTNVSAGLIPLKEWIKTSFVYNHQTSKASIYINGAFIREENVTVQPDTLRSINYFARSNWEDDDLFKGYMRDIRIWNGARTAAQIQENLNKELIGDEANLLAYYKFDESSGNTAYNKVLDYRTSDFSNGTIHGANWIDANGINVSLDMIKNTPKQFEFTIIDVDSTLENLSLSVSSSDQNLIADEDISYTLSGQNGVLTIAPRSNAIGSCIINITASDGSATHTEPLMVTVFDNEHGAIGFTTTSETVMENSTEYNIDVERTIGTLGAISANYSVVGGTAVADSDYEALSGTINFGDGDNTTKTITLKLINDTTFEDDETVIIKLTGVTGRATLLEDEVTITIANDDTLNNVPVANSQAVTTTKNTTLNGTLTGSDADSDSLTFIKVSDPVNGTVSISNNGSFSYTPTTDYTGSDSFKFKVNDTKEDSAEATVTITVNATAPVNNTPVANSQAVATTKNTTLNGTLTGSDADSDSLTFIKVSDPVNGTVSISNDGSFSYTPTTDYIGSDSFKFKVNDTKEDSAEATVTITVNDTAPVNNSPVANSQAVATTKNTTLNGMLTGSDADSDSLTFIKVSDPANGTVSISNDGSFSYTPTTDYIGSDSFNFKVNDTKEDSAEATVSITVNDTAPVNNGTISIKQTSYNVTEGTANISIQITRTGGSDGAVSVSYTTVDDTALAGSDYTTKSGTISFNDGDSTEQTLLIPITDDSDVEGSESFKLQISNATCGATIGISETVITITDNDKAPSEDDDDEDEVKPKVKGSVRDNSTGKVKQGTKVIISKDFDGDGVADFTFETTTDKNGNYEMNVPNANEHYDITIIKEIEVNGEIYEIPFKQQVNVGEVTQENSETYANKTAAGVVYAPKSSNGSTILEDNELSMIVTDDSDNIINGSLNRETGIFMADQLAEGKSYKFNVVYDLPNGQRVSLGSTSITPSNDGEICIGQILIDPFGIITDSDTGEIIVGAHVKLYYADTIRNATKGNTAGDLVNLPKVDNFPPADNKNPQFSDSEGKYAFMVFPEADYYIEAIKEGYVPFTSTVISVEQDLVEYNFSMVKKDTDFTNNFNNEITFDEGSFNSNEVKGTVEYQNNSTETYQDVVITVPIPDGMEVVEVIDGEVVDGQLVWEIGDVEPNESGNVHFIIIYKSENDYKIIKLVSVISCEINGANLSTNGSSIPFIVYSNNFSYLTKRYLMGYEDNSVRPDQNITRAEMISLFARLTSCTTKPSKESNYSDITSNNWFFNNVLIASEEGLLDLYTDTMLQPESNVKKAELAYIIAKFLGLTEENSSGKQYFTDIEEHFAKHYINQLSELNIFITDSTEFNPNKAITRAEAIVTINKMLHRQPLTQCESSFIDLAKDHWAFGDIEAAARNLALKS